jgi:hypothetical protein
VKRGTITRIIRLADSFLAVVFDTTKHRDAALNRLREKSTFEFNKAKITVAAFPFGDKVGGKVSVWTVPCGPLDSQKVLASVILDHLGSECPAFEIRAWTHNNYNTAAFAVRFASPPAWKGKAIVVKGQPQLIIAESPCKCRIYSRRPDHESFTDC